MKRIIWLMGLLIVCLAFTSLSIPVTAAPTQHSCYGSVNEIQGQNSTVVSESNYQTGLLTDLLTPDQSFIIKISLPLLLIMCGSAVLLSKWLKS